MLDGRAPKITPLAHPTPIWLNSQRTNSFPLMRVLIIGSYKPWRMESGIERALRRAGHQTLLLDDRRAHRIVGRALTQRWALWNAGRFGPDFVFTGKCQGLTLETVERIVRDRPSAMWYGDAPSFKHVATDPVRAHHAAVARLVRTFFVCGFVPEWRALGANAKFLPLAGDRDLVPTPPDPRFAATVSFTGTGYDDERARFLVAIAQKHRVRVWGNGWATWAPQLEWGGRRVEGRDFAAVCSSSAFMLGINPQIAQGATNYMSNRHAITMLAGGFYLGERTPGADRVLLDDVHCAWYSDAATCLERIDHYLQDRAGHARIRADGERFIREHHTFDQRIANILEDREWRNPLEHGDRA